MFIEIAVGAIGIAIVLMVGYIVVSQVKAAIPASQGSWNGSVYIATNVSNGMTGIMTTAFAGFGLIAVGIIVLSAFGIVQIFK